MDAVDREVPSDDSWRYLCCVRWKRASVIRPHSLDYFCSCDATWEVDSLLKTLTINYNQQNSTKNTNLQAKNVRGILRIYHQQIYSKKFKFRLTFT